MTTKECLYIKLTRTSCDKSSPGDFCSQLPFSLMSVVWLSVCVCVCVCNIMSKLDGMCVCFFLIQCLDLLRSSITTMAGKSVTSMCAVQRCASVAQRVRLLHSPNTQIASLQPEDLPLCNKNHKLPKTCDSSAVFSKASVVCFLYSYYTHS